jgi:hypothetical protein
MMEVYIGLVMVAITILFFMFRGGGKKPIEATKPTKDIKKEEPKRDSKRDSQISNKPIVPEKQDAIIEDNSDKVVNVKDYLVNSFRKDRELKNAIIYENGKFVLQYNVSCLV